MRKTCWLLLALLALCGGCERRDTGSADLPAAPAHAATVPASPQAPPAAPAKPELTPEDVKGKIALADTTIDLGTFPEGTPCTGSITILNGLDTEVEIRRVAGDCSCVQWEFSGFHKIPPIGSLAVQFHLKAVPQYAHKKIPVEVITSSNVAPRLEATITYECTPAAVTASSHR
ncbi:MAG: DUF1573 domain-containing protein [Rhodanobacteraceae bacterium]